MSRASRVSSSATSCFVASTCRAPVASVSPGSRSRAADATRSTTGRTSTPPVAQPSRTADSIDIAASAPSRWTGLCSSMCRPCGQAGMPLAANRRPVASAGAWITTNTPPAKLSSSGRRRQLNMSTRPAPASSPPCARPGQRGQLDGSGDRRVQPGRVGLAGTCSRYSSSANSWPQPAQYRKRGIRARGAFVSESSDSIIPCPSAAFIAPSGPGRPLPGSRP